MRKILALACAASLMASSALAVDLCNPCPPKMKWVEVCETVLCEVPVTEYVDCPVDIKVTKMVPCEVEYEECVGKWVYETKTVPYMKQVMECEEYTVNVIKTEMRCETRTRKVCTTVPEIEERTVTRKVCEEVCDPVTGRIKKVWNTVCEVVPVTVNKKVWVEEEYTVNVPCKISVPEVRTRNVCRQVQMTKEVRVPKYIKEMVTRTKTVMQPVVETQTVMKKKAVRSTRMIEKQVVKRVQVPVEPGCEPAC